MQEHQAIINHEINNVLNVQQFVNCAEICLTNQNFEFFFNKSVAKISLLNLQLLRFLCGKVRGICCCPGIDTLP